MINNTAFKLILVFMVIIIMAGFFCGCQPKVREKITRFNSLKKLKPNTYPVFTDSLGFKDSSVLTDSLDFQDLVDSIDYSLVYFKRIPLERKFQYGKDAYTAAHMIESLETIKAFLLKNPSANELDEFIRSLFVVYEAAGNEDGDVLFTGYFEPTYEGSLEKKDDYPFCLYSRPKDLLEIDLSAFSDKYKGHKRLVARVNDSTKKVVPYYSRAQINSLKGFDVESEPIVWLKSRVDRFFLEIQGSGRIDLGQGDMVRVHYACSNGNAYKSIGRYLIEKNEILKENMSMQAIRTWLEQHPKRMDEVLHENKSFVFFQREEGGPYGSLGVDVTALRSIATDSSLFPKGALCFARAQLPDKTNFNLVKDGPVKNRPVKDWKKASFFVLNQDTGGAIKGPARADIFCGNGSYAEFTAGHMNVYGKLFFLVLKPGNS
ncbi:murein transglycosylase A [Desulfobacula toluolica]|nr:MltA domain-containing protein [Desulfobacula toluolica]